MLKNVWKWHWVKWVTQQFFFFLIDFFCFFNFQENIYEKERKRKK